MVSSRVRVSPRSQKLKQMKKDNWNSNDWQGKSRRQVQDSQNLAGIAMIAITATMLGLIIYNLITHGV